MTGSDAGAPLTRVRPGDLRRLRWGQTVSMFGDEVTGVALPTVALLVLHATPFQFGLLTAVTYVPYPVLGLVVGVWVDRIRRRRVLLLADTTRFLAIASIPLAALTGVLTLGQLFAVGLVVGTASVFFNSAYQAFLPSIVRADEITTANAKLSVGETSSQVGGPPLAGLLISGFGPSVAMLLDAASYLASIAELSGIRRPEADPHEEPGAPASTRRTPARGGSDGRSRGGDGRRIDVDVDGRRIDVDDGRRIDGDGGGRTRSRLGARQGWDRSPETPVRASRLGARRVDLARDRIARERMAALQERDGRRPNRPKNVWPEVKQGLVVVFSDRLMRGLTLTSAISNLGRGMALELFLLFAYNGLHVSPATAGLMLATGNIGSFLGSLLCRRITGRIGIGRSLLIGSVMKGLPWALAPLTLVTSAAIPLIVGILIVSSFFVPISNVATLSIRQSLVPHKLQGRVAATTRTVTRTVVPLSAVLGGALATVGTRLFGPEAGLAAVLAAGGLLWTGATGLLPRARLRDLHSVEQLETLDGNHSGPGRQRAVPGDDRRQPSGPSPNDGRSPARRP